MADFDPAKEAINLSKHGISLARWVDLEVSPSSGTIGSTTADLDIAHTASSVVFRTV
ncbi:hypothetical protein [Bradyrhizobium sp.]|jgi:uncharacterized DUF497 family protein|uniref:hypothetical protein n=1 Tax=Bradyrhizobium sp. TaxID=376 RepID=UPI003BB0A986